MDITQGFVIDQSAADVTTPSQGSTSEETLTTLTIPANRLAVGDSAQFLASGELLNHTGSNVTYTWRFKPGAASVATDVISIPSSGQPRKWRVLVDIQLISPTVARLSMLLSTSIGNAASWVASTAEITATGYAEVDFDSASDQPIALTVKMGTANALATVTKRTASIKHFPAEFTAIKGVDGVDGESFGTLPQTTLLTEGGGYHYVVPGFSPIAAASLLALSPNTIYYEPFELWDESYWPNIVCEVTTGSTQRVVTDMVLNGTKTITSETANFTPLDVNRVVSGTGIPSNTKIASVTDSTTAVMAASATTSASGVSVSFGSLLSMAIYKADNHYHPVELVAQIPSTQPIDAGNANEHIRETGLVAPGGRYLKAIWTDGAPTMRTVPHGSPYGFTITGSSGIHVNRSTVFQTYNGLWPDPGVPPTTIARSGTPGAYHTMFLLPGDA